MVLRPPGVGQQTNVIAQVRELMRAGAEERVGWIRTNITEAIARSELDLTAVATIAGVSPGTVRNFLKGTDSSLANVIQIGLALGLSLSDLERPPAEAAAGP